MDLAEFLLARIGEDEAAARKVLAEHEMYDWESYLSGAGGYGFSSNLFAERFNPTRVLAECEAKRRIVELAAPWAAYTGENNGMARVVQDMNLRLLALPYADHPDYRSEWAP
jgi:hypothetical protein